jgi:hypothetical protein
MMNFKGFVRKRSWPNFEVLSWYLPGGTEENRSQDGQSSGRDLNPKPPEFEAEVSITRTRRSVHGSSEAKSHSAGKLCVEHQLLLPYFKESAMSMSLAS